MTIELVLLAASIVIGIVHIIVASQIAELATRLSVDCELKRTGPYATHRRCRKG